MDSRFLKNYTGSEYFPDIYFHYSTANLQLNIKKMVSNL